MPRSNVTVRSDLSKLKGLGGKIEGAVGAEVRKISLDLLGQSVNHAPVEEGTLRGSGTAHFGGNRIASGKDYDSSAEGDEGLEGGAGTDQTSAVVAFNAVYAEAQHERTDFAHPKGGEAKYLERPLEKSRGDYERKIAEAVKGEIT